MGSSNSPRAAANAERLNFRTETPVTIRSVTGEMNGVIQIAPAKSCTLQAYWPEANVLITGRTDLGSGEPDYNAEV
jgi:hypothetical protein